MVPMNASRREFLARAALAVGAAAPGGCGTLRPAKAGAAASKPNFVIFLTDDQGYGDLGCMGARDLQTPHLDAIAADGVRFTNWYSNSPVCSPSRAALLTGRYPCHAGVRQILGGERSTPGLPLDTPTLAEALKPLGYRTGLFGKWHLGAAPEYRPDRRGFDESFNFLAGCIDYYSHIFYWGLNAQRDPVHDLWHNGQEVWENGRYFTELAADHATEFVRGSSGGNAPFFMYVAFNAPHYPMHAPKAYMDRFTHLPPERQVMAAMLAAVDDGVGRVVDELKRQGVYDNTCILFMSDNGPSRETRNWLDGNREPFPGGSSGGLMGSKFSLYEGGIRVPGLLCWPDRIKAGQVIEQPAIAMDAFPTFLRAAGGDPGRYDLDGVDLMPALAEGNPWPDRPLFWEYGEQTAVRDGNWKLVLNGRIPNATEAVDAVHLSDLAADPGEKRNLAAAQPEETARLRQAAGVWRAKMGI
jgi:arylsulfatase A-like enzyme